MSASDRELENMAKAHRMNNAELAAGLRTIARIQDDDALAKWVLGVAADRLSTQNAAPAPRKLDPLDCKRPGQPGQV